MDIGYYIVGAAFLMCGVLGYWLGKTPIIDMPKKRTENVEDAFEMLAGYCKKHEFCTTCHFYSRGKNCCYMDECSPVCDWSIEMLNEWKMGERDD